MIVSNYFDLLGLFGFNLLLILKVYGTEIKEFY